MSRETNQQIAAGFAQGLQNFAQGYARRQQNEKASEIINNAQTTPIQKAMALASINQEGLGKEIFKASQKESQLQNLMQMYQQAGLGGAPNVPGATASIRPNEPVTTAQPGSEGTGSPTQPGFSPSAPSKAASNATALNMPPQAPMMRQLAPQVAPNQQGQPVPQQQLTPRQEAQRLRALGGQMNAVQPGSGTAILDEAKAIEKQAQQEKLAEAKKEAKDKDILLEIHKSEKKAYDALEAGGQQAKKTSRARETMIAQLASGKLNPKSFKNIAANMFKGNPVLEGLFTTPEREVFKSAGITQFEGMKDIFGVRLSDADLAIASTKVMDPAKPVEANLAIAKYWDFSDKMKIQESNIAREVKKENGGLLPINWREQVHDRMQERFGDEAERVVRNAASEGDSKPLKIIDGKIAILSPEGKRRLIPQEQLKQALLAGGIPE